MGIVCPLSPEIRAINKQNLELEKVVKEHIQQLQHYSFSQGVISAINNMPTRYMFNQGILQDIEKLHSFSRNSCRTQNSTVFQADDIRNSCLILQNQSLESKKEEKQEIGEQPPDSFLKNVKNNQSLVVQINILYQSEIKVSEYSSSLNLFLKWARMFQEHTYGGFLKPIYTQFYHHIVTIPKEEYYAIVDEICVFVQFMVSIVTDIYGLRKLTESQHGKLIKNQNAYNLIMTFLFKRTKIQAYLLNCIRSLNQEKIGQIDRQLKRLSKKPLEFFGVDSRFTLQDQNLTESQLSKSTDTNQYIQPYFQSLKLVQELCQNGSPITKLKTIVAISKQILRDIHKYYDSKGKQAPDLDPDNLSSIVMYLLARTTNPNIFEELRIVESFTTTNCLNCISGYYLNVFVAALETILTMKASPS